MGNSFDKSKILKNDLLFPKESYQIKGACLRVYSSLGCGFLEKVYENAVIHELNKCGFSVQQQAPIKVRYDGIIVGDYTIDVLVNDKFIIEIKATEAHHPIYDAQLVNYLKATGLPLGFLANFGMKSLDFKRIIFTKKNPGV